MRSEPNPFAQSQAYWKVCFTLPAVAAGMVEDAFNDIALAVSGFETDEVNHIWSFEALCAAAPDEAEFSRRLMLIATLHQLAMPTLTMERVEQRDWLAAVAQDFPPLVIGRFYVHGAHVTALPPPGSIAIQVDAGAAFGSGEHGTTSGCLKALAWLARQRDFYNILDMGCGSGILAIAAAKLWKSRVLAVDIDTVAVRVARENAMVNRVQQAVDTSLSDGYAGVAVMRRAPYDLIVSNILAAPLMAFAGDLKANLKPGGVAVLSGLLTSQEAMVRSAHAMQGLRLRKRFQSGAWSTLVLQ